MGIFREGVRFIDTVPSVHLVKPATPLGRFLGVSDKVVGLVAPEKAVGVPQWRTSVAREEKALRSVAAKGEVL